MRFASPIFFIIIVCVALVAFFYEYRQRHKQEPAIRFSDTGPFNGINPSPRVKLRHLPRILRYAAVVLILLALARPQAGQHSEEIFNRGVDIMMLMDTSSSMRALDFKPDNRYEAAKKVAKEFVKQRKNDRIGIVIFAGLAYTQCPLTADHDAVMNFIDQTSVDMTGADGTAIGSAIATATNRLKNSPGKSKIIILITDGRNNAGEIDPLTAAQAAAALSVKIYTIGAGQPGGAVYPVDDPTWGRQYVKVPEQDLDEDTLAKIAETTGGRYFRATDSQSLERIMKQINDLEKSDIKTVKYTSYRELFGWFLWPAFGLVMLESLLSCTWLRTLP
ncbi:MAG: VWA domain-containing protein [Endomicrobiales bacterium]|jgi:Ca-activated chloride channel family protein